jgi:hypothetical protein
MSLQVLAYNLKRMIQILGVQPLIAAIKATGEQRTSSAVSWPQVSSTEFSHSLDPEPTLVN